MLPMPVSLHHVCTFLVFLLPRDGVFLVGLHGPLEFQDLVYDVLQVLKLAHPMLDVVVEVVQERLELLPLCQNLKILLFT